MRNDATLVVADTIEMQHLSRLPFSRRAMKGFVDNVTLLQRWCKRFLQVKRPGRKHRKAQGNWSKSVLGWVTIEVACVMTRRRCSQLEKEWERQGAAQGNTEVCHGNCYWFVPLSLHWSRMYVAAPSFLLFVRLCWFCMILLRLHSIHLKRALAGDKCHFISGTKTSTCRTSSGTKPRQSSRTEEEIQIRREGSFR